MLEIKEIIYINKIIKPLEKIINKMYDIQKVWNIIPIINGINMDCINNISPIFNGWFILININEIIIEKNIIMLINFIIYNLQNYYFNLN